MADKLEKGKKAFQQRAWKEAYNLLASADRENKLEPIDLEQLARSAYLIGKETKCTDYWIRVNHEYLNQNNLKKAADCAFWLGMIFFNKGDTAQGSGWIARAERLIDKYGKECVEQGFLLIPKALQNLREGNDKNAENLFRKAIELGNRFNNYDLMTLGTLGRGQALIHQKKIKEGTKFFDEAMVAVISDDISPIVAGIVYCAVIDSCQKIYDLQRAQEWTEALSRWCDSQPDLIPYRGQCLVRRAEIMQFHGEWPQALEEVRRACEMPSESNPTATGEAFYRRAEIHRLQGNFTEAETFYRKANKCGRNPQPGLALLRMGQGQIDAALNMIIHVVEQAKGNLSRSKALPAYIEILLAAGDNKNAKVIADELLTIAKKLNAPFLEALADRALGSVHLANGKPGNALIKLRKAWALLNSIEASYESARTQLLIGLGSRKIGDYETATLEFDSARSFFQQIGAMPDFEKATSLIQKETLGGIHGLTPRELEVLQILATGKTNKAIAGDLFISERTVDRHVSNILSKLNLPSRAAATAYAYKHELI